MKSLKTALSFKASYDTAGSWRFGSDLSGEPGGGADTGVLDTDLRKLIHDLADAAEEEGVGLAILIDEAHDLTAVELAALCTIAHAAAQDSWRVLFAFAGLPSLPRILAEAKSYAEPFRYLRIEQLDERAAAEALTIPARIEEAEWSGDAIQVVVEASGRYPYFLQQFGQETWNVAAGPVIHKHEAELGVARGKNDLDNGFYRARWDRATRAEQEYLRAMARDGDAGSSSGEIAVRLARRPESLGPRRASLIAKGGCRKTVLAVRGAMTVWLRVAVRLCGGFSADRMWRSGGWRSRAGAGGAGGGRAWGRSDRPRGMAGLVADRCPGRVLAGQARLAWWWWSLSRFPARLMSAHSERTAARPRRRNRRVLRLCLRSPKTGSISWERWA